MREQRFVHEELHTDILDEMRDHYGWSKEEVVASLNEHASNQITMTYHLLEFKKEKALVKKVLSLSLALIVSL